MITRLMGFLILGGSLYVVYEFEGSANGFLRILHWPAMVLTGFGPMGLVMFCFDSRILFRTLKLIFGSSADKRYRKHRRESFLLHRWVSQFYQHGNSIFDKISLKGISDYVARVVERLSIRMPTKDIRGLLEKERDRKRIRFIQSLNVLNVGVRVCPSLGMLGTILGMVQLLATLEDPSHIGQHMSLALLTTFYGLFFSLVFWTPLQQKVERVMDIELTGYDQLVEWLEIMEQKKPTNYFADHAEIPAETHPQKEPKLKSA